MKQLILLFAAILALSACNNEPVMDEPKSDILVQVSVIDALLQGIYDGFYPVGDLPSLGSYGIGTFDALDGEMVVFNDTVFQVVASGEVKLPAATTLSPFAALTNFKADTTYQLANISFDSIKNNFDTYFPTPNIFYAVKMHGTFSYMKTRSVPKQSKPYPPLVEVTRNQPEFEFEEVTGDIIGFFCPDYASGINVTGLHLHFLNSSRTGGGHILNFTIESGTMELGYLLDYRLILPTGGDFYGGDFTVDRSDDLEEAEN